MWQVDKVAPPTNFDITALFRGLLVALSSTVVLILALAMLLQYTSVKESILPAAGVLVIVLSNLVGGFTAGRRAGNRGIWHGLGVGLAFACTTLIITLGFFSNSFTWAGYMMKSFMSAACGIMGGILGVGYSR
jgi:putative membrane protein (TIGR04086 family)